MTSQELAQLKGMLASGGPDFSQPAQEVRAIFDGMLASFPVDETLAFENRTVGGVPGLWLEAATVSPNVLLYVHGGGMLAGESHGYRGLSSALAIAAETSMFSIDYRLAPEHQYPAALNDVLSAIRGLIDDGYPADRIVVAGDSAGGGLVLAALIALRRAGEPQPQAAVVLSPWADLTLSGTSMTTKAEVDNSLSRAGLQAGADQYLAGHPATDPLVSAVFGELHDIAPLLIEVGSEEILLSDSLRVAQSAGKSRVDVTLHVWPNQVHDWSLFAFMLSEGRDMISEVGTWIRARLDNQGV
jgi:monoterpene epsilon-lactone hydrolase